MGSAPLMSFQHGAHNEPEMQSLWKKSVVIMGSGGVLMWLFAHVFAVPVTSIFVGYDAGLMDITLHAFSLYTWGFIFMGFSIYASALFTSLGQGLISAAISFLRTLVFEVGAILLLPLVLGVDGVWLAFLAAEAVSFVISWACMLGFGRRFAYLPTSKQKA